MGKILNGRGGIWDQGRGLGTGGLAEEVEYGVDWSRCDVRGAKFAKSAQHPMNITT